MNKTVITHPVGHTSVKLRIIPSVRAPERAQLLDHSLGVLGSLKECNYYRYPINNPYEFLGYIYYYLELCSSKYEEEYNALTSMDGVKMDVLETSGRRKDLWLDTSYVPEKDQNIIDSVTEWKKKEEK